MSQPDQKILRAAATPTPPKVGASAGFRCRGRRSPSSGSSAEGAWRPSPGISAFRPTGCPSGATASWRRRRMPSRCAKVRESSPQDAADVEVIWHWMQIV